ncbi:antibiotic biosynthesis monooxygenase [Deinococcus cellulosilyticus]|uniref:antibiotic biosynthesis monooxygenase n=1 Tax=Deinococcus cellulosilyticus TaxID=401558 RepID=UPI0011BEA50C|nr:antibiotic biosynthesis monooxygenase [Deinococcus cellulosilyticus]
MQEGAVTFSVSRLVRPDRIAEFEAWVKGFGEIAQKYPGHLGVGVIRPVDGAAPEYTMIIRFDSYDNFKNWQESPERQEWLDRSEPMIQGEPRMNIIPGLEYWFTPPTAPVLKTPPQHKQVVAVMLGLFPLSLVMAWVGPHWFSGMPFVVRQFFSSVIVVVLMTYLVMPNINKWLRVWLTK